MTRYRVEEFKQHWCVPVWSRRNEGTGEPDHAPPAWLAGLFLSPVFAILSVALVWLTELSAIGGVLAFFGLTGLAMGMFVAAQLVGAATRRRRRE
jgi:amino acid permease